MGGGYFEQITGFHLIEFLLSSCSILSASDSAVEVPMICTSFVSDKSIL